MLINLNQTIRMSIGQNLILFILEIIMSVCFNWGGRDHISKFCSHKGEGFKIFNVVIFATRFQNVDRQVKNMKQIL